MFGRKWIGASALAMALSAGVMTAPAAHAQLFGISVNIFAGAPPPPLPVYEQPPIPAPGYIFVPGYWAWDQSVGDYFWVPATWVQPPQPGLLWTPGYWGRVNGRYGFAPGYWDTTVGFYGGVNYGFGYTGSGYGGGYWRGNQFFYNRSVNNITNVRIANVYERPVPSAAGPRVSFNGPGGVTARPSPEQVALARKPHVAPPAEQTRHVAMAREEPALRASSNHGKPPIAATAAPGRLQGPGVVPAARAGGAVRPPAARPGEPEADANRPAERAPEARPSPGARPEARPAVSEERNTRRPAPGETTAPARPERERAAPAPSRAEGERPPAHARPEAAPPRPEAQREPPKPEAQRPAPKPAENAPPKREEEKRPPE